MEAAPTPTGYIPHQDEVGGVGVAKARTLVIYNNLLWFGDTALLLLPQVLLWTQESLSRQPHSHVSVSGWVGETSKTQDEQTVQTEDAAAPHLAVPQLPGRPSAFGLVWRGQQPVLSNRQCPWCQRLGGFVPAPIHTAFSLQTKTLGLVTERCCYGYANADEGTILNWGHQCDCSLAFSLLLRPRYRKRHPGQLPPAARRPQRSPQGTRSALPPIGNDGTLPMCIIPFQLFSK